MQLKKLHIKGFKNLEDVCFDFDNSYNKNFVIGNNGSGKSNLLEAISLIFKAIYLQEKNVLPIFQFEIEYVIERFHTASFAGDEFLDFPIYVKFDNLSGEIQYSYISNNIEYNEVNDINVLLPEHVVAVYSGEEKRLFNNAYLPIYKDYNEHFIKGEVGYKKQSMIYLDKAYWDIVAAVLSIYDNDEYTNFLSNVIHLGNVVSISCEFDIEKIKKNKNGMLKEMLDYINPNYSKEVEITLEQFYELKNICGYEKDLFFNLIILCLNEDFKIITKFVVNTAEGLKVSDLSEGEKKLLLLYGAKNIIEGENLFLFDEPDSFLHPEWQIRLIEFINEEDYQKCHYLITTHSPLTLTYVNKESIFLMKDGENYASDYSKGRDVNSVLTDIMDVGYRPKETDQKIAEISKLINERKFDEADEEIEKLSVDLGLDDYIIQQLKLRIKLER